VLEIELALQRCTRGSAPDPQSSAGWADLDIAMLGSIEQPLCPFGNSSGSGITRMINISGGEGILR
jgi:hypothetical protein